ncbi:hypothetical protein OG21DRAFT_1459019 [Imleria badia]|nr:hypothetical protein OG21DRAFT_1459019 [Imleria badia]
MSQNGNYVPNINLSSWISHLVFDDLEATGALQRSNRMDVTELLNPAAETHNIFDATDEDICEAMMDAKMAREGGNGDSDEVGDTNGELGTAAEPSPTRSQALQAPLLLKRYLADMDDPAARRLEAMLGFFGRMTRVHGIQSMENGKITNFFARK